MDIGIIGCGVMGSALAHHLAKTNRLKVYDKQREKGLKLAKDVKGVCVSDLKELSQGSEVIILAVKPKDLSKVGELIDSTSNRGQILISMLAGTSVALLSKYFPQMQILRIMPNLPLMCGKGVVGLVRDPLFTEAFITKIEKLFDGLGLLIWLPENQLEALSAISGSGPGFVFLLIEAFIEGGIYLGFSAAEARQLVLQTMEGAIEMIRHTDKHPAQLKWDVASPGGTTIVGLLEMERMNIKAALMNTLIATYHKGLEMQN